MDPQPNCTPQHLTRALVARRLHTTIASVRRLEARGRLHPVVGARGVRHFDADEVERVAAERGLPPVGHAAEESGGPAEAPTEPDPAADTSSIGARQTALEARQAAAEGRLAEVLFSLPQLARRLDSVELLLRTLAAGGR